MRGDGIPRETDAPNQRRAGSVSDRRNPRHRQFPVAAAARWLLRSLTLPARLVAIVLLLAAPAAAQTVDPPLAGRPQNFSHLVGRFKIATSVTPNEVVVEDPLTLRVVITGDVAAGQPPTRSRLRILPDDLAASFFVEPVPAEDVAKPKQKTWEFVWKLRPKSTAVRSVPSLLLTYYSGGGYQFARSKSLPIDVKPRPTHVVDVPYPADLPDTFFQLADPPSPGFEPLSSVRPWSWFAISVVIGLACWMLIRSSNESHNTAGAAVAALDDLTRYPDDALNTVAHYFHERLRGPIGELTAGDVDALLERAGVPRTLRSRWQAWSRDADARRFAAVDDRAVASLAPQAAELIRQTEAQLPRSNRTFVALAMSTALLGASPTWDAGREAFQKGVDNCRSGQPCRDDFARAADTFAACGDSAEALANVGNARFLAGQLPEAIAVFRSALRLDPSNPTARRHLDYVRRQVAIPEGSKLVRPELPWTWNVPESWLRIAIPFGLVTAAIALALRRRVVFAIAATIGVAAWCLVELRQSTIADERSESIVVLREATPLRVGNANRYDPNPDAPTLPRGYEVRVIDKRGGWIHVVCPGGQIGWAPEASAIPVERPAQSEPLT